jgi:hypothetical protein
LRDTLAISLVAMLSTATKPYLVAAVTPLAAAMNVPAGVFSGRVYTATGIELDSFPIVPETIWQARTAPARRREAAAQ